jgi:hypothetical protein
LIDEGGHADHDQHETDHFSEFHEPSMTHGRAVDVCPRAQSALMTTRGYR